MPKNKPIPVDQVVDKYETTRTRKISFDIPLDSEGVPQFNVEVIQEVLIVSKLESGVVETTPRTDIRFTPDLKLFNEFFAQKKLSGQEFLDFVSAFGDSLSES